jgi:hypothetical protein
MQNMANFKTIQNFKIISQNWSSKDKALAQKAMSNMLGLLKVKKQCRFKAEEIKE